MCLIAFAIGSRPDLPLVIASNRDEQWSRTTQALQAWELPSGKTVYSGRDLQAGGTWLGLAQDGRVAMLTNVRNGNPDMSPRSRGELVTGWLDAQLDWQDWLSGFDPLQYGGFNLVLGDLAHGRWAWVSNRPSDQARMLAGQDLPAGWHGHSLSPGLYGLSNAALDTPWPKTVALKQALQRHLVEGASHEHAAPLLESLLHMSAASDEQLPETGVPLELERRLSSPFVHAPEISYGTRSSMIIHWHDDGSFDIREWTHAHGLDATPDTNVDHWPISHSRLSRITSVLNITGT